MQGSSSSGGPEGQTKRKTAQAAAKKDAKSNSSKQSSRCQEVRSQSSDGNQQIKDKNSGKQVRQEGDNRKSERLAVVPQGEKKEHKQRTSSDVTSQSVVPKQPNENGVEVYGAKQKIEQQFETMENAFGINDPTNIFLQQRTASQMETQEQLSQQLQKLIENRGNHPTITLGPSTSDYFINDYNINVLPDRNPIQRVIEDFVSRRHAYQSFKVKDSGTSSSASVNAAGAGGGAQGQQPPQRPPKPRLEEFLGCLQEHVFMVNKIYKVSKQQFEDDVKAFKYIDEEGRPKEQMQQKDQGKQQQPQPWNLADKQPDKPKKKDGQNDADNGILPDAQLMTKENHKVNEVGESQPSLSDQLAFPKQQQSGQPDGKDGENKLMIAGAAGPNQLVNQPPYYQPFQNPMQVPLNGPLRSINNIMLTQQMNLITNPAQNSSSKSGMAGQVLQVPLSKKQQRSQTVQNFIQYLAEFYEGFESQANVLQGYYPKHIQKCIQKKKSQNAERIAQSIKVPSFFNGGPSSKLSQKQQKRKAKKALSKMSMLTKFQATMMQVVLQKIDRRSKPIRKQTKIVTNSLHEKQIHLEEENFDILQLLRQNNQSREKDGQGQSQSEGQEQAKSQSDQRTKSKDPIGLPKLSAAKAGQEKIGGLNNLANLSEIDLTLTKGASKTKASTQTKPVQQANTSRLPSSSDPRAPSQQQSETAPGIKKSKVDQRKLDREERLKEREKEKGRKDAAKEDKKRKGKTERKEDEGEKKQESQVKHELVDSANQNKKRGREQAAADMMTSPAFQGRQAKAQQQKGTSGRQPAADGSTFGMSCTAVRKVQRPHMFNPYEVSNFHDKQKIEQLLCSGDVVRPHKIEEVMADAAAMPSSIQQPPAEKKIQLAAVAPQTSGAKHKSKHGRKHKKGDGTLNLSKGTAQPAGSKVDEKGKKDDKASNKSEQQNAESHQQQQYQQYMLGGNGPNVSGFPDFGPQPFSLHPAAGSMGYNMHIGNVYYHQHHEHHHYGPPINHMMFGFPGPHPHSGAPFLAPPPPPQYYKHQMPGTHGMRLNSNGSKQSGGKSPIDLSADDMIIPPMMHQGGHSTTTPKSNLYQMGAANLGSGSNNQGVQQHRTHMQTFHHHHYHTSAFPHSGTNRTSTQGQMTTCPKPPRGPISIQTNTGHGGSSVCSPDAKIVTSTTHNYDQHRNMGATKFYQSVNQASAAMLCGGATGGFNHNISPSPQNNYKLGGGNMGIGMSGGQTQSKDGSSLINLQPCEMGVEYHTNVGPGNLSGISEFVLPLHPVPMNNMDKELGVKDTPAAGHSGVDGRTGHMGMPQPLFNQEAFSIAATADFMNNQAGHNSGRQEAPRVPQHSGPALSTQGHYSSITPKSALLKLDCHFFSTGNVPQARTSQLGAAVQGSHQNQNVASTMMNIGAIPTPGAGASGSMSSLANVASMVQIVPGPKNSGRSGTPSNGDNSVPRHREK